MLLVPVVKLQDGCVRAAALFIWLGDPMPRWRAECVRRTVAVLSGFSYVMLVDRPTKAPDPAVEIRPAMGLVADMLAHYRVAPSDDPVAVSDWLRVDRLAARSYTLYVDTDLVLLRKPALGPAAVVGPKRHWPFLAWNGCDTSPFGAFLTEQAASDRKVRRLIHGAPAVAGRERFSWGCFAHGSAAHKLVEGRS
jgi:hypothetical protein